MFTVYSISSPNTHYNYIGYAEGEQKEAFDTFMYGATRKDVASEDRGDVRFLELCGDEVRIKVLEQVEDQIAAHYRRNYYRAHNPNSFTGPSNWPLMIEQQAEKKYGTKNIKRLHQIHKARNMKTAREAYTASLFTFEQIMSLAKHPDAKADLDALTPNQYIEKYQLEIA